MKTLCLSNDCILSAEIGVKFITLKLPYQFSSKDLCSPAK